MDHQNTKTYDAYDVIEIALEKVDEEEQTIYGRLIVANIFDKRI